MTSVVTGASRQRNSSTALDAGQLVALRNLLVEAMDEQALLLEQNEAIAASLTAAADDAGREREMARVAADRAREAIDDIVHALARLDDGSYGTCEACERPIPFERLEAIPYARSCISCRESAPVR